MSNTPAPPVPGRDMVVIKNLVKQFGPLNAVDGVFLTHERLWQQSKQEAIQAVSAGFAERMTRMREELSDPAEPLAAFLRKAAQRVRNLTGRDVPHDDAEAFIRESARIGLIRIES